MPSRIFCTFLLLVLIPDTSSSCLGALRKRDEPLEQWVERRLGAMGTGLRIEVAARTREQALAASEQALRAIEACERRLSTWGEDSQGELAQFNRSAVGEAVVLSQPLALELQAALGWSRATGGAFNPAIGPLVRAWDLRGSGRRPGAMELSAAIGDVSLAGLDLLGTRATRRRSGLVLEEGGFGKGAGLDAALAALRDTPMTSVRLDLGGQWLIATGTGESVSSPTILAVAHPSDRDRPVLHISVTSGSLATSGNSERGIVVDGEHLGHVLDPRTGNPAPDFGSITVLAPTGLAADALSTGLYVMGPDKALEWCSQQADIEVLALLTTPNGLRVLASPGLRGRIQPCIPTLKVEFSDFESPAHPLIR